jgi:3-hydroxybutyryl-CoA dehydratase
MEPFVVGHRIAKSLLLSDDEIIAGARFLGDRNPIHNDPHDPATRRFGGLIACGPHVSGMHACMLPSHCVARGYDVLGTVFTVRYAAPFPANSMHEFAWEASSAVSHRSGGVLVDWKGTVTPVEGGRACIVATGQVLLNERVDES